MHGWRWNYWDRDEHQIDEGRDGITGGALDVKEAEAAGVSGKSLTPFLLARLVELTAGQARRANEALLLNNARVAARIARAL